MTGMKRAALYLSVVGLFAGCVSGVMEEETPSAEASLTDPGIAVANFSPAQSAQFVYQESPAVSTAYWKPDALTVLGRVPTNPGRIEAAQAGGLVSIYLDVIVHNNYGPYHTLFFDASACGAAIPKWSGTGTSYGPGADIRVSHFASKFECVVRKIKADHPYIRSIFLDDYGPGWTGYTDNNQRCQARQALGAAFDRLLPVGAELGLMFFANTLWHAESCGGWPDASKNGLRGAVGVWEHHPISHGPFADGAFGAGTQWLKDANGKGGALIITYDSAETDYYAAKPWASWVSQQADYGSGGPVVRPAHSIGLTFGRTTTSPSGSGPLAPASFSVSAGTCGGIRVRVVKAANDSGTNLRIFARTNPWGSELAYWGEGRCKLFDGVWPASGVFEGDVSCPSAEWPLGSARHLRAFSVKGTPPPDNISNTTATNVARLDSTPAQFVRQ
jgi:hypothetical protein